MKAGDYPGKLAGRPRVEQPQRMVGFRLSEPIYVRLERVASARGESISSLVRNLVILRLPKSSNN